MSSRESIIARAAHAVARVSVKSALNPMLWLSGLITVPALITALVISPVPIWLVSLACAPVLAAIAGFVYLLLVDRDKLQSESYQLRKQALELIEEKGDFKVVDATTIEAISSPELRALPGPDAEVGE